MNDDSELGIAWAAGLFEGEGSISCVPMKHKGDYSRGYYTRHVCMSMTDHDVLVKLQLAIGLGKIRGPYQDRRNPNHKQSWVWTASGYDEMVQVLELFRPYLCSRRQEQIDHFLSFPPAQKKGAQPGNTFGRANKGKTIWVDRTHCRHGHDLAVVGVYTNPKGYKTCRQCERDSSLRFKRKASSAV